MAIPEGVETVTVSSGEPLTLPDGTLIRGHIKFIAPDLNLIDDEDYIFGGMSPAELCHGEFSITVVAPDATGITPTGWTYTVVGEFENAPGWTRYIDITKDDPDVFLDDVIVLTPGDVTYPDTTFVRKLGDTMLGDLILNEDPTTDLQAATKHYVDEAVPDTTDFVQRTGDTMLGPLVLDGDPSSALEAAPKQYVDQAEQDAVNAAVAAAAAESVSLSGDTMTGPLILSGAPAEALGAATKAYADAGDDERVAVAGDTMTGPLILSGAPAADLQASTKKYVDDGLAAVADGAIAAFVAKAGDTMTGPLTLPGAPVNPLHASTKQYADDVAQAAEDAAIAAANAESVSKSGDTMTGALTLPAVSPANDNQAARKKYVDDTAAAAQAAAEATAAAESVSLDGDTMTGLLVLSGDPVADLGAATKQYTDGADETLQSNIDDVAADLTALDGSVVKLTGDQTIAGVKTFSSIPAGPATNPTTANQLTRKAYVDSLDGSNVKVTGDQTVAGVKTFSSIPVGPGSDPTTANQLTRKSYVDAGDSTNAGHIADVAADLATLDGEVVKLTGDQAVAGVKTFSSIPVGPASDPTTDNQLARKRYVDDRIPDTSDFVDKTNDQTVGGVKTFTSIPVLPATDPTLDSEAARKLYVDDGDAAVAADVSALDGAVVKLTGDQTVAGIKTFSSIPVGPGSDPTTANQLTRKSYVDAADTVNGAAIVQVADDLATLDGEVVKLTGAQTIAGVKTFSSVPVGPASDPANANDLSRKAYVDVGDAANAADISDVASDLATLDGEVVKLTGDQTVSGIKTFTSTVQMESATDAVAEASLVGADAFDSYQRTHRGREGWGDGSGTRDTFLERTASGILLATSQIRVSGASPANAADLTRKDYVDTLDGANVKLTGAQTVAGVKTFSSIPVGPASDPTTANQLSRKSYVDAGDTAVAGTVTSLAGTVSALDAAVVKLTGDQSVDGVKSFTSIPVGPASDPSTDNQLTRKLYVDTLDAANVKLTGTQTVAGVKTFSSIPVLPASDPTTANQATRKSYVDTLDGANVKLTGAQSIGGVKTFSSTPVFNAGINVASGIGADLYARKTASTSRSSTITTTADPHLVVAVEANAVYNILANLVWRPSGSGGFRFGWTLPTGCSIIFIDNDSGSAIATTDELTFNVTTGSSVGGILVVGGTAGNVTLKWAQNASNATATVLQANSSLWLRRVA
ncbi:hypothetical protein SEA_DRYAD_33 [Streptomyces phage Dryad]|nr:hypothetical protein SEA_DRYAD_33 [Streptomyces phage Dryad]